MFIFMHIKNMMAPEEVQLSMAVFQHLKSLLANVFPYLGIFEGPQMSPRIRIHGTSEDGFEFSSPKKCRRYLDLMRATAIK